MLLFITCTIVIICSIVIICVSLNRHSAYRLDKPLIEIFEYPDSNPHDLYITGFARCTEKSVNLRLHGDISPVIGIMRKGAIVEVSDIRTEKFTKIRADGVECWACTKYLKPLIRYTIKELV